MAPPFALLACLVACTPAAERKAATAQDDSELAREVERLRAELQEEREKSRELGAQVEWLRHELDALAALQERPDAADAGAPDAAAAPAESGAAPPGADGGEGAAGAGEERWFDADALARAGVPPAEVERLRDAFDRSEMSLLELRNQATREGWVRSPRFYQETLAQRTAVRDELGDDSYDMLLYATGRTNRAVVADVLRGSPGDRAGLKPGDVVLAYGEKRIFRPTELQRATTAGRAGDRVSVWVLRDGERLRLYLDRGPIGVKLRPATMLPEEPW